MTTIYRELDEWVVTSKDGSVYRFDDEHEAQGMHKLLTDLDEKKTYSDLDTRVIRKNGDLHLEIARFRYLHDAKIFAEQVNGHRAHTILIVYKGKYDRVMVEVVQ